MYINSQANQFHHGENCRDRHVNMNKKYISDIPSNRFEIAGANVYRMVPASIIKPNPWLNRFLFWVTASDPVVGWVRALGRIRIVV